MAHFQRPIGQTTYQSFLVRLWCETSQGDWRASAQHVRSQKVTHFASLYDLFSFLQEEARTSQEEVDGAPAAEDDAGDNADG